MPQYESEPLQTSPSVRHASGSIVNSGRLWGLSAVSIGAALPGILIFRPGVMYGLTVIGFIAAIFAIDWRLAKAQVLDAVRSPVTWLSAAMLVAFLISAAIGINPGNSISKWSQLFGAGVATILMTVALRQMPVEQLNLLARILALATLAMMFLALIDIVIGSEPFSKAYQGRIRGFSSRLQFFSSALSVLLPLMLAALAMSSAGIGKRQLVLPAAVAIGIITTLACGGRSGWAGTAASLATYGAGLVLVGDLKLRSWHIAFTALVVALGIGLYWHSYGTAFLQQRMMMAQEAVGPMSGRLEVWKVGIAHLGDNPLLGIGLTNYKDLPEAAFRHPHNWALQLALETGAIGFLLFCAFVGAVLWAMWKTARANRFGLASIAATIGFLVAGLANTSIVNMWWLTFFILGSLIGYELSRRTDNPYSSAAEAAHSA